MIPLLDPRDARHPTAIALGSFDGLHAGHRRVIEAVLSPGRGATLPGAPTVPSATGGAAAPPAGTAAASAEATAAQGPQAKDSSGSAAAMGPGQAPRNADRVPRAEPVPTVVSFWPHPRELLHGETRLRLDLPHEKLELLEPLGIQQLVLLPFTQALAALSPEAFVEQVLVAQLQARRVAVGTNFRFGAGRSGDGEALVRLGARHGIAVTVVPVLEVAGEPMSSSRIRRALAAGEIAAATRLLQRPYRFSGVVATGRGLGRQLGWPTANLRVDGRKFLPLEGVYAAWVWLQPAAGAPGSAPPEALAAVMNLGPQPTVDPLAPSAVEVHLLDRTLELVGARLTVEPVRLLRRQQRFAGLEELSERIGRDADEARRLLGSTPPAGPPPQPLASDPGASALGIRAAELA